MPEHVHPQHAHQRARSYDVTVPPPRAARERTPDELATAAKAIADNLERAHGLATVGLAAMVNAAAIEDRAAYDTGRKKAVDAIAQITGALDAARRHEPHAADDQIRQRLANADSARTALQQQLDAAPPAPEIKAPVLSCEASLRAALPPDEPVGDAWRRFAEWERAVKAVIISEMTASDIAALARIRKEHPDHELSRRFCRFGGERLKGIEALVASHKVRAMARAREDAQRRADAAAVAPPPGYVARPAEAAARATPGTIDAPPSYEETRGTIDIDQARENQEARERGGAGATGAAVPAHAGPVPATIDAPAHYEETRGTIDTEEARRNREARDRTAGAGTAPTTIDAPPRYEETGPQTIERPAGAQRPAATAKRATSGPPDRGPAATDGAEREPEPAIGASEMLLRDPTGGALRANITTRLDATTRRLASLVVLAPAFQTAVGDLELEGVIRIGIRLLDEYGQVIQEWNALDGDLAVAEGAGAALVGATDTAAAGTAALRGRYAALTAALMGATAAIARPLTPTTFRHRPVPGATAPPLTAIGSEEYGALVHGEIAKTTTLVAIIDEIRVRVAGLDPGADPPRDVIDLVEAWQGDRSAFLFLHHVLGEIGLSSVIAARTRNGKTLDERAAQVARGVPQLAEDIPRTIEEAKAGLAAGDRAAAGELLALAMERMRELGNERRIREIIEHGGGGGHALGLQMEAVQEAEMWVSSAQREIGRGMDAKGSIILAIRATRAAVPIYRVVSGEGDYAATGFAHADDFAALNAGTAGAMLAALAMPKLIPKLALGAAAAFRELAIRVGTNPHLALEIATLAASLGLQIGEGGVGAFLESLQTPEGMIGLIADILAIKLAAGPTHPGDTGRRGAAPAGKGDASARISDIVDRVQAFADASIEWVKARPARAGATAGGPNVRVPDDGPSFSHVYEARVTERRRARVDAGGISYYPTPEQRRAGYHPPDPAASPAELSTQLAAEARVAAPVKDAMSNAERAAAYKQQADYFAHVEQQAQQEKYRLSQRMANASPEERAALEAQFDAAERLERAARVKPIGGKLPQNHAYAGDVYPAEQLPAEIRGKYPAGVLFTSDGFPDFAPYAKTTVTVPGLVGDHYRDFSAANRAANLPDKPKGKPPAGFTWHHHQDGRTMLLVPKDLHAAVAHSGGAAVIKASQGEAIGARE